MRTSENGTFLFNRDVRVQYSSAPLDEDVAFQPCTKKITLGAILLGHPMALAKVIQPLLDQAMLKVTERILRNLDKRTALEK